MKGTTWMTAVVGIACVALAAVTLSTAPAAEQAQNTYRAPAHNAMHRPMTHTSMQTMPKKEMVTLEIRGANSAAGARLLGSTLTAHQVNAAVQASQGKPYRVTATIDPKTDLGAAGQAIMTTSTPDRALTPPSLDLVVFGKFDKASAKKASEALAKIKGIDAKDSNANISAGELNIRVNGGAKVTADQIHRALQEAGVWTQFTRNSSARRS
jgi:hypothetical protein